jgi:arylsulfatase
VGGLPAGARTLWVVLSDHGEAFMEHGIVGHGSLPYEEVVGVPLVIRGEGVAPARRLDVPVHHVDLMPTLLELLGVPVPDGLAGRSVADLIRPGAALESPLGAERPRFTTSWATPDGIAAPAFSVKLGSLKLIRYRTDAGEQFELYDLVADPREARNLYPDDPERASELVRLLDEYTQNSETSRKSRSTGETRAAPLLDPEREDKLRALGYIE